MFFHAALFVQRQVNSLELRIEPNAVFTFHVFDIFSFMSDSWHVLFLFFSSHSSAFLNTTGQTCTD